MVTIGELDVAIGLDMRELERGLQQAQKQVAGFSKSMDSLGRNLQRTGRTLSAAVTLPLVGIGAAMAKLAIDAEETANKFDVVFGEMAGTVRDSLADIRRFLPATTQQLEAMASGLQDLLVPMGVARREAAGLSVDFIRLAGDIGSFNNVATTDVLEAFRSALAGQSRPLRQFGIDISETALKAVALEKGLIRVGDEMTSAARAQAILIQSTRQSADALGDAERTMDSTANTIRRMLADVRELGEEFGQVLVPMLRPYIDLLKQWVDRLRELTPQQQQLILQIGLTAAAVGPLLIVVGTLIRSLGAVAGAIAIVNRRMIVLTTVLTASITIIANLARLYDALARSAAGAALGLKPLSDEARSLARTLGDLPGLIGGAIGGVQDLGRAMRGAASDAKIFGAETRKAFAEIAAGRQTVELSETQREFAAVGNELAALRQRAAEATDPGVWVRLQGEIGRAEERVKELARALTPIATVATGVSPDALVAPGTGDRLKAEVEKAIGFVQVRRFEISAEALASIRERLSRIAEELPQARFEATIASQAGQRERQLRLEEQINGLLVEQAVLLGQLPTQQVAEDARKAAESWERTVKAIRQFSVVPGLTAGGASPAAPTGFLAGIGTAVRGAFTSAADAIQFGGRAVENALFSLQFGIESTGASLLRSLGQTVANVLAQIPNVFAQIASVIASLVSSIFGPSEERRRRRALGQALEDQLRTQEVIFGAEFGDAFIDFVRGISNDLFRRGADAGTIMQVITDNLEFLNDLFRSGVGELAAIDQLLARVRDGLDDTAEGIEEAVRDVASALSNVPTGFRVALARFNATVAGLGPRDPTRVGAIADAQPTVGFQVNGDVVINAAPGESGESLLSRIESAVMNRQSRGGGGLQLAPANAPVLG